MSRLNKRDAHAWEASNGDPDSLTDSLEELLDNNWSRDGNTIEHLSLTEHRVLIVVGDNSITVHSRGARDADFSTVRFTGTEAAQHAATHARSVLR